MLADLPAPKGRQAFALPSGWVVQAAGPASCKLTYITMFDTEQLAKLTPGGDVTRIAAIHASSLERLQNLLAGKDEPVGAANSGPPWPEEARDPERPAEPSEVNTL